MDAYMKQCRKCGKNSHFQAFCRSGKPPSQSTQATRQPSFPTTTSKGPTQGRRHVRCIQDDADEHAAVAANEATDSDEYAFTVGAAVKPHQPIASIKINKTPVDCMLDTGASVNIIDEASWEKFKQKPTLTRATARIFAYGSDKPMSTLGAFHAEVESKHKFTEALFYVVKGMYGSLLSC
jgi:hypothetical protein